MNEQLDPKKAAGDFVAGDLTPAEAAAFEQAMQNDPSLAQDVAFWRAVRGDLAVDKSTSPPPLSAAVIKARIAERQDTEQQKWRRRALSGWLTAAAAGFLVVVLVGYELFRARPFVDGTFANGEAVAFLEDGTAISLPAHGVLMGPQERNFYGDHFMPTRVPVVYENARDAQADLAKLPPVQAAIPRPCLGIIVQPVPFKQGDTQTGLLIVRVMGHSPAVDAGIKPGDVLLAINGTAVYTRYCIAHALSEQTVGSPIQLSYFSRQNQKQVESKVNLGAYFD